MADCENKVITVIHDLFICMSLKNTHHMILYTTSLTKIKTKSTCNISKANGLQRLHILLFVKSCHTELNRESQLNSLKICYNYFLKILVSIITKFIITFISSLKILIFQLFLPVPKL